MMRDLTTNELETIKSELWAFNTNFKEITIKKFYHNYQVFQEPNEHFSNYIYSTANILTLKGWLYGAVQANCKIIERAV